MLARLFAAFVAGATASASEPPADQPLSTDSVRDEATAIKIGEDACGTKDSRSAGKWMASYANREWTVRWIEWPDRSYGEIEVTIRADTGSTGSVCSVTVS